MSAADAASAKANHACFSCNGIVFVTDILLMALAYDLRAPTTINPTPPANANPPRIGGSAKLFLVSAVMLTDPTSTNVSRCVYPTFYHMSAADPKMARIIPIANRCVRFISRLLVKLSIDSRLCSPDLSVTSLTWTIKCVPSAAG